MTTRTAESFFEKFEQRTEYLRRLLSKRWLEDPTVLASFDADVAQLRAEIEQGDLYVRFAGPTLTAIYNEHLPVSANLTSYHLPTPGAEPVPGHGQFYQAVRQYLWKAIDYRDSRAYRHQHPSRELWLTYTSSAARQAT